MESNSVIKSFVQGDRGTVCADTEEHAWEIYLTLDCKYGTRNVGAEKSSRIKEDVK